MHYVFSSTSNYSFSVDFRKFKLPVRNIQIFAGRCSNNSKMNSGGYSASLRDVKRMEIKGVAIENKRLVHSLLNILLCNDVY